MVGQGHFWLGARADYAIRALAELARVGRPVTADALATAQAIPKTFLTVILSELRRPALDSGAGVRLHLPGEPTWTRCGLRRPTRTNGCAAYSWICSSR